MKPSFGDYIKMKVTCLEVHSSLSLEIKLLWTAPGITDKLDHLVDSIILVLPNQYPFYIKGQPSNAHMIANCLSLHAGETDWF
jgi:hypothetical protein